VEAIKSASTGAAPVAVIIPFFNARETLRYAVFSVLNQLYLSWQLILLNDGSVDDSVGTISDLIDNESILLISESTNRGLISRLNQMVELTDATYIARMDSDDLMHPDRLLLQMEAFKACAQLDIVSSGHKISGEAFNFRPREDVIQPVSSLIAAFQRYWEKAQWEVRGETFAGKESRLLKLCCDKVLSILNWRAILSFEESVEFTASWYRKFYMGQYDMLEFSKQQIEEYCLLATERATEWVKSLA